MEHIPVNTTCKGPKLSDDFYGSVASLRPFSEQEFIFD